MKKKMDLFELHARLANIIEQTEAPVHVDTALVPRATPTPSRDLHEYNVFQVMLRNTRPSCMIDLIVDKDYYFSQRISRRHGPVIIYQRNTGRATPLTQFGWYPGILPLLPGPERATPVPHT